MTGNNTIILNQTSLKDAVQHYFNTRLFREGEAPRVVEIGVDGHLFEEFQICVSDYEEPAGP